MGEYVVIDTIYGGEVRGTVIEEYEAGLMLETNSGQIIFVPFDDIANIEYRLEE